MLRTAEDNSRWENGAAELSITLIAQWDGSGRYTLASTTRPVPADGLGTVLDALASLNSRFRGPKPGFEPSVIVFDI